jgi:hypothetical protein
MFRIARIAAVLLLLASPVAFAKSDLMTDAADQAPKPQDGKAMVVFLRPSFVGGAIASTVYDAPDGEDTFLGSVAHKEKLAYQAEPGHHRFMVIAENADFLDADLEAGKTYYVLIKPRMGVWKARFSLIPIHAGADAEYSLQKPEFHEWDTTTHFVEKAPAADAWYADHKASIDGKKADYLKKWNVMAPQDRAVLVLHGDDGVAAQ